MKLHFALIACALVATILTGCTDARQRELAEIEQIKRAPNPPAGNRDPIETRRSQPSEQKLKSEYARTHKPVIENLPPEDEVANFPGDLLFGKDGNPDRKKVAPAR